MTHALKIAYLVSRYPALSHTFILREIKHLRELGADICVASVNAPDRPDAALTAEERAEAAQTYYLKRDGLRGAARAHLATLVRAPIAYLSGLAYALRLGGADAKKLLYGFFYFVEAVMLGQWLRRHAQTHLHVHFATPASTVALIARRIFGFTFSLTVHGPDEFYNVKAYYLREKIVAANFICCISSFARSQLMALSAPSEWHKFEVTRLGVDTEQFAPRPFREKPAPFELLCVGRLVAVKGQHILLQAFARLRREGADVRLRLVGDGPERAALEKAVAAQGLGESVIFEGGVNQDRIRALYRQADAFVLASFAEGIPVVLMEAMAMEIPCLTTRITGVPELIRDGQDGLLVPASDADALADALTRLMNEPVWRQQLGAAGRRRVEEKYHLRRNTDYFAQVLQRRQRLMVNGQWSMVNGVVAAGPVIFDGASLKPVQRKLTGPTINH